MTRINCVPVEELHQKHLIAEYRELPRVFSLVQNYVNKHGKLPDIPSNYVLGKGHVTFFYNKLKYLADRQKCLINEMKKRGYSPQFDKCLIEQYSHLIDNKYWNDWVPSSNDIDVNLSRIRERIATMKK